MPRTVVTYDAGTWDVAGVAPSSSPVTVTDATLSTSDITTNNVTTAKHGFTPKLPNDATKYLDGTGAYTVPAGTSAVSSVFGRTGAVVAATNDYTEAQLSFSDITTNNASTSKHGFAPKYPNDATKYLDGTGAYTVPSGGSGSKIYFNKPAGTITRASATVGAFSTAWQITGVVVASGQNVRLRMSAAATDAGANRDRNFTIKRGSTVVAAATFNAAAAANVFINTLEWIDENPGAGTYTYEVQGANFVSGTLSVFQSLPSTDTAGGSSIFIAEVYTP